MACYRSRYFYACSVNCSSNRPDCSLVRLSSSSLSDMFDLTCKAYFLIELIWWRKSLRIWFGTKAAYSSFNKTSLLRPPGTTSCFRFCKPTVSIEIKPSNLRELNIERFYCWMTACLPLSVWSRWPSLEWLACKSLVNIVCAMCEDSGLPFGPLVTIATHLWMSDSSSIVAFCFVASFLSLLIAMIDMTVRLSLTQVAW